jgi:hypothetical protein
MQRITFDVRSISLSETIAWCGAEKEKGEDKEGQTRWRSRSAAHDRRLIFIIVIIIIIVSIIRSSTQGAVTTRLAFTYVRKSDHGRQVRPSSSPSPSPSPCQPSPASNKGNFQQLNRQTDTGRFCLRRADEATLASSSTPLFWCSDSRNCNCNCNRNRNRNRAHLSSATPYGRSSLAQG